MPTSFIVRTAFLRLATNGIYFLAMTKADSPDPVEDGTKSSVLNQQMTPFSGGALLGVIAFVLVFYRSFDFLRAFLLGGVAFCAAFWVMWAGQVLERRGKKNAIAARPEEEHGEMVAVDAMEGTWRMLECGRNGNFAPTEEIALANVQMKVKGDRFTMLSSGEAGRIVIDNSIFPTAMDQIGDDGDTHLCIARLVNGQLEICQGEPGRPRPGDFSRSRKDGASLVRFVRVVDQTDYSATIPSEDV